MKKFKFKRKASNKEILAAEKLKALNEEINRVGLTPELKKALEKYTKHIRK
jgi:hypothetical protein